MNEMNGVLYIDSTISGSTGPRTSWTNEIFAMNHIKGPGQIARPDDLQPSAVPLCKGFPLSKINIILLIKSYDSYIKKVEVTIEFISLIVCKLNIYPRLSRI